MPLLPTSSTTNQSGARASQNVVGRDLINNITYNHLHNSSSARAIEILLTKLEEEIRSDAHTQDTIDRLQRYRSRQKYDEIAGLEAKLSASNRSYEYIQALEMKELFSKLLERFSLYASAQEILAYLLARVEYNFTQFIYPQINSLSIVEINELVDQKIVEPTIRECGASTFAMDHSLAMGMIYWLADQCFVRWHR